MTVEEVTLSDYSQINPYFAIFLKCSIQVELALYQVFRAHCNLDSLGHYGLVLWDVYLAGYSKGKTPNQLDCVFILQTRVC